MTKIDRKIPVPVSADSYVIFDIPEMEALEQHYGENVIRRVIDGIDGSSLSVMRKCLEVMLKDGNATPDEVLSRYPFSSVGGWLLDAIGMSLHGRRYTTS